MGIPKAAGPLRVRISYHANKRIRQRRLDHRAIVRMMYDLPYSEGTWEWDPPGMDMRLIFVDEMRMRTVVTAYRLYE